VINEVSFIIWQVTSEIISTKAYKDEFHYPISFRQYCIRIFDIRVYCLFDYMCICETRTLYLIFACLYYMNHEATDRKRKCQYIQTIYVVG
jgi:hypothetical protein